MGQARGQRSIRRILPESERRRDADARGGSNSLHPRVGCTAVIRSNLSCMTMLSFRVPDDDAAEVQRWADALGIDRSEILRDALHRHLVVLDGEADARRWEEQPATDAERSLEAVADWGPAEDWSDWGDAEG